MRNGTATALAAACILAGGCMSVQTKNEVEVKPIEIKPMKIDVNVNVNVRVQKELDDFFGDMDQQAQQLKEEEK